MESRYSRQKILGEIGAQGQRLLGKSRVIIVGCGALGTTTANLLARSGVGHITIVDRDIVEEHNLQRQTLFSEADVGLPKAVQAAAYLQGVNSTISIVPKPEEFSKDSFSDKTFRSVDLILDATDNMQTRFLINDLAKKYGFPWIYCSAIGTKGQLYVVTKKRPCFSCLFSEPAPGALATCATAGVLSSVTSILASMQVTQALKILTKQEPDRELVLYDAWENTITKFKAKKKKTCSACKEKYVFLESNEESVLKLCGKGRFHIRRKKPSWSLISKRLKGKVTKYGLLYRKGNIEFFLFKDGRCIIKAKSKKEATTIYAKYVGN